MSEDFISFNEILPQQVVPNEQTWETITSYQMQSKEGNASSESKRKRENDEIDLRVSSKHWRHKLTKKDVEEKYQPDGTDWNDDDIESGSLENGTPHAPWFKVNRKYSVHPIRQLHEEILDLVDYLSLNEEEHQARVRLVDQLRKLVMELWPDAKLKTFGSFATSLYLPTSDIDVVIFSRQVDETHGVQMALKRLATRLKRKNLASHLQIISRARVPLVKMVDRVLGCSVDFSFNVDNGPRAVPLIRNYIEDYPAARPLVLMIKLFLQQRGLNEVFTGGIGSFSLTLLVVSFLQLHPRLQHRQIRAEENLGVLLIDLLELYGKHFNYSKTGISLKNNGRYFSKSSRGWTVAGRPFLLALEDPQDRDNDVGRNSFNIMAVRQALEFGYSTLVSQCLNRLHRSSSEKPDSILSHIIRLTPEMIARREQLLEVADSYLDPEPLIVTQSVERMKPVSKLPDQSVFIEDVSGDDDGHEFAQSFQDPP
jgi:non-canonical poly(A) RNA polymerase PAPD5/7